MGKNMHKCDRIARIVLGLAIGIVTLLNAFGPNISWVLAAIGLILIVTGAVGICPAYSIFKFRTNASCCCQAQGAKTCEMKNAKSNE